MWPAGGEEPVAMGRGPSASAPRSSAATTTTTSQHSPWQSPVPYLFGGLAAMLGLIALSLLALACSYWKLSAIQEPDAAADRQERRAGGGDGEKGAADGKTGPAGEKWLEQHVVVIMAGDERPTFLATPAASGQTDDDDDAPASFGSAEQGRCVECGARARPADLEEVSRSEQSAGSGSSASSGT